MSEAAQTYWIVVEPLFAKIDTSGTPETYLASIASLPRSEVGLFAAHLCLGEIYNGGFLQFYWNNAGVLAPEAIEGFDLIGMPEMAALLRDTDALLGDPYPRVRDDRWDALLNASRCSEARFKLLYKESSEEPSNLPSSPALHFYRAFVKATEPLGFDALNEKAWQLAGTENDGFGEAASRYVQGLHLAE